MMGTQGGTIGAALVAVGLLTACSGEPSAAPAMTASTALSTPPLSASPTPTASPSPTPTPTPTLDPVVLVCGNLDEDVDYAPQSVPLAADGTPDFTDLWKQRFGCDTGMGDEDVAKAVPVQTPLQRAIVALAKKVHYGDSDEENLYYIFQGCGENQADDYYATSKDLSDAQVDEIRLYLVLCPGHPHAKKWRAGIAASADARQAEKDGTRVYEGTYKVPSEMKRGTYIVKDVENCYWETRNSSGDIIANNFVLAAPRVVAVVGRSAVVFTAEGCGEWNRK